jgi:ABC-type glutathione transport system ATPase component
VILTSKASIAVAMVSAFCSMMAVRGRYHRVRHPRPELAERHTLVRFAVDLHFLETRERPAIGLGIADHHDPPLLEGVAVGEHEPDDQQEGDRESMGAVVEARGLCKEFGPVRALDDVSFTIEGPGLTTILGPNGAGKSM